MAHDKVHEVVAGIRFDADDDDDDDEDEDD